jgi:hypothetical protein
MTFVVDFGKSSLEAIPDPLPSLIMGWAGSEINNDKMEA